MSTTIDQKVVEMKFDNRQFESNVRTSMSTLEKLKQSLNLNGAAKGLENVNAAAKDVNMTGLGNAVQEVHARFSALEVMGVTALANITNSAVNAGKRMMSALTIDPIKTGFQEYETQINSVQTILANTQSKGSTIDDVTAALDELNKYADLTIYNFTEMTRNIGTFTAAGVDLETSVSAIQGIANLAAVSGSTSQQASTAMYQLSQALAAGTVKLMDWNSVVNAGMGGEVFQNALKKTSELLGTGAEAAIKAKGSFRESLQTGWLTSEVLTETLKKFTTSGATEYVAEYTGLTQKAVEAELESAKAKYGEADAIEYAAKALAKKSGKNENEIKEALQMAETATNAATKVKTFSQLWDVMKEAAQSGWAKTWQLIIGDFEEAKNLLTPLADFFTNVIEKISDARNKLLEGALNNPFAKFTKKLDNLIGPAEKVAKATEKVTNATKDYADIVNKVIGGEFGNGASRWEKLTEAGYDWAKVQNMVNEKLGDSTRHKEQNAEATDKLSESTDKAAKAQGETIEQMLKMSDAQLKDLGLKKDEIEALRELEKQSEKTGIPVKDLIKDIDQLEGRTLLINSFKNIGQGIVAVFTAMGSAWKKVFPPMQSEQLYNIIAGFHKLTLKLRVNEETADKFYRTFRGVFSILKIATTLVGGPLKIAFKVLSSILGAFDMNILDLTANVGDAIYYFSEWLDKAFDLTAIFKKAKPYVQSAIEWFKEMIDTFLELPQVQKAIDRFKEGLSNFDDIGKNIIKGLKNGLEDGIESVPSILLEIGKKIIAAITGILGIHSPSTVMYEIGSNIIAGLVNGVKNGISQVGTAIKSIGEKIFEVLGSIPWDNLFAAGISIAMVVTIKKLVDAFETLAAPLEGLGELFSGAGAVLQESAKGIGKVLKSFSKVVNAYAFSIKTKALKDIAISLTLLIGAVIALTYVYKNNEADLWKSVGVVAALAAILVALAFATSKISAASVTIGRDGVKTNGLKSSLIAIGTALLLMAATVKMLGKLNPEQAQQGFTYLVGIVSTLIVFSYVCGQVVKGKTAQNADKLGKLMLKLGVALAIFAIVVKMLGGMKPEQVVQGTAAILAFVGVVALLSLITNISGKGINKLGGLMFKISVAMILMVGVIKLINMLSPEELLIGGSVILGFIGVITLLSLITNIAGNSMNRLGKTLMGMAGSMLILTIVIKMLGDMEPEKIMKGYAAILAFTGVIALLTLVVKMLGSDAPKMAMTIVALSVAIGILAGVAILLSLIDTKGLAKGIIAVTMLGSVMSLMIWATRGAEDCKGNIIAMAIAIGVMAVAVAALSMIDGSKLAGATIALSVLMGMFALVEKAGSNMQSAIGNLIVMAIAIGLIGGLVYLLAKLPIESTISVAASLSVLLLSLSASMMIISKTGTIGPMALVSIGVMVLVVGALAGILYLLSGLPVASTLAVALSLSGLLVVIAGVCTIISFIPAAAAIQGAIGLAGFVAIMAVVLAALGALSKIPGVSEIISSGGELLATIGYAIGKFVGSIVGGIGAGISSGLPEIATNLSNFMTNLQPFIEGAKTIDSSVTDNVKSLAGMILALTAANILESVTSWITGGSSMTEFAEKLVPFGKAIKAYANEVMGIDAGAVTASATAAKSLAELANNLPNSGGVAGFFAGENDLNIFAEALAPFGKAMKDYSLAVAGIDNGAITASATAAKSLAELANNLPNSGGLVSFFSGDNTLTIFGEQLVPFGTAMKEYAATIVGIDAEAIIASATAAKSLAELANNLPNSGGLVSFFTGDNALSTFGDQLGPFGTAMKEYADTIVGINSTAVIASSNAAKSLAELANNLPNSGGLASFFTGESDMSAFGEQLIPFGESMLSYSKSVSGINAEAIIASANGAKSIIAIATDIYNASDMISSFSYDMTDFSQNLTAFGKAIKLYSTTVYGLNTESISASVTAVKSISDMAKNLPNSGGLISVFTGENDMSVFAENLIPFGKAIKSYSTEVCGIDPEAIAASVKAAKSLSDMAENLPNSGGLISLFEGDNNMADFASDLTPFGEGLKKYSIAVAGVNAEAVSVSVSAAKSLVKLVDVLPASGFGGVFSSDSGIGSIGSKLVPFGKSLKQYADAVSGINAQAVNAATKSAKEVAKLINSLAGINTSGVNAFKNAINTLGKAEVNNFVKAFSEASVKLTSAGGKMMVALANGIKAKRSLIKSAVVSVISEINRFVSSKSSSLNRAGSTMMISLVRGMESKRAMAVNSLTKVLTAMVNILRSKRAIFTSVGSDLMTRFILGLKKNSSKAETIFKSVAAKGIAKIRGYHDNFYNAGTYLVDGFSDGISDKTWKAEAKARAMAQAALDAAKEALDENSPSKEMYKIGAFAGQGFINALVDYGTDTYKAGLEMADYAKEGLSNAISSLKMAVNSDIDVQPTIRPVLDLSAVEAGAGTISSLFGESVSIGTMANVSAISSMMSARSQNGANDDVVSAIDKLRGDIGGMERPSYVVNGITYDDGSNISNAVESLIRAARIERRM